MEQRHKTWKAERGRSKIEKENPKLDCMSQNDSKWI